MTPWPPEGEPSGKGTKPVTLPRPGHADLAGVLKYGHRRRPQRARARIGAAHGRPRRGRFGRQGAAGRDRDPGRGHDRRRGPGLQARIDEARADRDTVGGVVEVRATGVPPGLGSYASKEDRLDARLAAAVMGIQAVKGVEIGDGFALAGLRGSQAHDEIGPDRRRSTNRAGGLEAGVSNGEEIVVRAAMKPLPTLMKPLALGRPRHRRAGGGARRTLGRGGGRGARRRRRGGRRLGARRRRAREVRRRRARRLRGGTPRVPRAHPVDVGSVALNALDRHLALIGFMGAGKTTIAREVAERLGRRAVEADRMIEGRIQQKIGEFFASTGRDGVPGGRGCAASRLARLGRSRCLRPRRRRAEDRDRTRRARARCVHRRPGRRCRHGVAAGRRDGPAARRRRSGVSRCFTTSAHRCTGRLRTQSSRAAMSTASCSPRPASTTSRARSIGSASSCPATGPSRSPATITC